MIRSWWLKPLQLVLLAFMSVSFMAQADASDPYQLVQKVTGQLVSAAQAHNKGGGQDDFDREVMAALEPVVAFDYIARVVMGEHYKAASAEQREAFAKKFKAGLVVTYAKGIATYADSNIKTLAPAQPVGENRRVTVEQDVEHEGSKHKLSYTMQKNRDGQWKLTNLILNGVNLGRSLSGQFQQLANKYKGDVEQIIRHWDASES